MYQVEHKDAKKSNEMYYPRFTKVIVNFFMTKDQSILRRNKVNWHFARDDHMFTMIKLVSRHQNTQQYGAILPVELTNEAIRNSESYKEYYAIASGAKPPKTKASVRKKQSSSDTTMPPPTTIGKRLKTSAKIKLATKKSLTQTHISHASGSGADEGIGIIPGVPDVPTYKSDDEEISCKSSEDDDDDQDDDDDEQTDSDNNGDDFVHPKFSTHDEEDKDKENFDPIVQTPSQVKNTYDEDNAEDSHGMNIEGDEGSNEEAEANELYKDVNINLEGRDVQMADVQTTQVIEDTHVTLTSVNPKGIDSIFESTLRVDVSVMTTAELALVSATTLSPPSIPTISHVKQTPAPSPANVPRSSLQDLPNFGSLFGFDHRLKTLETNFSEFMQTNQFVKTVSSILGIVDKYIDQRMNEAVKVAVRLQSDRLQDEAQAKNEDFLNKLDENIQKIIKEQVKVEVSKILPIIEKTVNEQLEDEVLTRSSNSSKTSYVVAADLSKLELKKILIEKMERNKSVHRSDEQKNLYKALVYAYECDKLILDTYRDMATLKILRDDEDKDEEPSAGSNRGSKRRREGKEPESTSAPKEKTSKTSGKSIEGSKSHHKTASEYALAEKPMHATQDL
nr:hypothetical protein [Tanacetum cinerariifolium]